MENIVADQNLVAQSLAADACEPNADTLELAQSTIESHIVDFSTVKSKIAHSPTTISYGDTLGTNTQESHPFPPSIDGDEEETCDFTEEATRNFTKEESSTESLDLPNFSNHLANTMDDDSTPLHSLVERQLGSNQESGEGMAGSVDEESFLAPSTVTFGDKSLVGG